MFSLTTCEELLELLEEIEDHITDMENILGDEDDGEHEVLEKALVGLDKEAKIIREYVNKCRSDAPDDSDDDNDDE